MKTKIILHFYAKSTKKNTVGKLPIYVRLTVNGERLEFSSKKFIDKAKWSPELAKMRGSSEEARSINSYLDMMHSKVLSTEMDLLHQEEEISIENFQAILIGTNRTDRMLIPIFQDHNNKMKELLGKKYAHGALQRFQVTLNHIQNFLLWKYQISDIRIDKINHALIMELEFYRRSVKNCANNTTVKYIRNFRKIINNCLNNDWLDKDPFSKYEGKVYEIDKQFLTEEEIQRIYAKRFLNTRLEQDSNLTAKPILYKAFYILKIQGHRFCFCNANLLKSYEVNLVIIDDSTKLIRLNHTNF